MKHALLRLLSGLSLYSLCVTSLGFASNLNLGTNISKELRSDTASSTLRASSPGFLRDENQEKVLWQDLSILVLTDIHLDLNSGTPMDLAPNSASYLNELDRVTWKNMVHQLQTRIDAGEVVKPNYIVLLGDLVAHLRTSYAEATETEIFQSLKQAFPDIPVLYAFGNNDSLVGNYGAFLSSKHVSPFNMADRVYPHQQLVWATDVCMSNDQYPCLLTSEPTQGYYASYLAPQLRSIVLNSVLFSKHVQAAADIEAAKKQLNWLQSQLEDAEKQNESVLLIMHIPPGKSLYVSGWWLSDEQFWREAELKKFLKLIQSHHKNILGIWSGHTHKDELKVIQDQQHQILTGVYVTPAMSTRYGNAAGMRMYTLSQNDQQWSLSDYKTYQWYQDKFHHGVNFRTIYSYRDYYCSNSKQSMTACLANATLDKLQHFYTVANPNFAEAIYRPNNWILQCN